MANDPMHDRIMSTTIAMWAEDWRRRHDEAREQLERETGVTRERLGYTVPPTSEDPYGRVVEWQLPEEARHDWARRMVEDYIVRRGSEILDPRYIMSVDPFDSEQDEGDDDQLIH